MQYPTLYKRDTTGKIQQWAIEVEEDRYRTIHGDYGGKQVTDKWTVAEGKNTGKANATTGAEQATKEALAAITLKKKKGYTEDINNVDQAAVFKVMLAEKFSDYSNEVIYPVWEQPKLDGLRCRTDKNGLWSRDNNQFKNCPHIEEALKEVFETYPDLILDGEMYNHDFAHDFNSLVSFIKKGKPTEESIAEARRYVQYWLYNKVGKEPYHQRYEFLLHLQKDFKLPEFIKIVPCHIAVSRTALDTYYEENLEKGFEGQMLYDPQAPYVHKRTKALLKRKEFIDREYRIVKIEEGVGNRSGMAGAVWFVTDEGKEFKANPKGNRKFLTELLRNSETLIGERGTVEYQNLTPDGIPRFGRVTRIRNNE